MLNPIQKTYSKPAISQTLYRGSIYDRNGILLAIDTPYNSLALDLRYVNDLKLISTEITPILDVTDTYIEEACKNRKGYVLLSRKLTPYQTDQISSIIKEQELTGLIIENRIGRTYPQTTHAAQVIGFTDIDGNGIEGLEYTYNDYLKPIPKTGTIESVSGNDVYLTIDMKIQSILDDVNLELAEKHTPESTILFVLDAVNGDILGLSSYPFFDPNYYWNYSNTDWKNIGINSIYEPGSVFKVFTLAALLDINQADFEKSFYCDGSYSFIMPNNNRVVINCLHPHGMVTPREIIKLSCNGAIADFALQTDSNLFYNTLLAMGFGSYPDAGFSGEAKGLLEPVNQWSGRTKPTLAFGQEIGVTALQIVQAATVLTNNGDLLKPHIIKKIVDNEQEVVLHETAREVVDNPINAVSAEKVLSYMTSSIEAGGTAIHAAVPDVPIGAKTGTAELLDPETGSYKSGSVLSSTLAIAPIHNPKYIIYVAVNKPGSGQEYGSIVAAPTIKNIITAMISKRLLISESSKKIEILE